MEKTKIWSKDCNFLLDSLMEKIKDFIIIDIELTANENKSNEIKIQDIEISLYKSIMLLNEFNKFNLVKQLGTKDGFNIIRSLENLTKQEISNLIVDDIKKNYGKDMPKELQGIIDLINDINNGMHNE